MILKVNTETIKKIGFNEALFIAYLEKQSDNITRDGFVEITYNKIENDINLKRKRQNNIINNLGKLNIVEKKVTQRKRYLKLNMHELNYLIKKEQGK